MLQVICLGSPFIIFKKSVSTLTLTLKARDQLTFDECLLRTSVWFYFNEKFLFQTKSAWHSVYKEGLVYMCSSS